MQSTVCWASCSIWGSGFLPSGDLVGHEVKTAPGVGACPALGLTGPRRAARGFSADQWKVRPPSIARVAPVTKEDSSLVR
jgi:hypothetical protein